MHGWPQSEHTEHTRWGWPGFSTALDSASQPTPVSLPCHGVHMLLPSWIACEAVVAWGQRESIKGCAGHPVPSIGPWSRGLGLQLL